MSQAIIRRVIRRIVFEESLEPQPLPVQVFHVAADQLRQVPIDPQTVDQRQRLDGSFNFLHRAHAGVYLLHANAAFKGVVLIARYFEPNERAELYRLCGIEVPPDDLVAADAARFLRSDRDESKRDAKFSVRVLPAYDFTCALTRYRMIAVDGSTPLDAAHIQQFKRGGPCESSNGLALSKTVHWLFDRGFWSINDDYTVLVKSAAFEEAGDAGQLLKPHAGRQILLPTNCGAWPNPMFLGWHRANHGFEGRH